eukprot:TRINITY_DN1607_c0_g1_i2.p1 TRINITY_DN1607_c0_g1~~TRINITY_DN1607_c0_g1_i2.p1  ORF type:complete len:494 (+),score=157.10 TRINITY_DN1607_c0_g1_i2:78-1484(+)
MSEAQASATPATAPFKRPSPKVGFSTPKNGVGSPTPDEIPMITKSAPSEQSKGSSVKGTPVSVPRTPAQLPPPATPESVNLDRQNSKMSNVSLPQSAKSQRSATRSVSHASGISQRTVSKRSANGASRTSLTPPFPPQEDIVEVASVVSGADAHLVEENERLSAQVASLQRLLQDQSAASKEGRLAEEIKNKAKLIGKLEKENAALLAEVAALRDENSILKKTRRKSVTSQQESVRDSGLKGKLKDLQMQLDNAPSTDQVTMLQESVCTLRKTMAEKDVELQVTSQKLDKAQDALLAAIDWETEVKLSETKKALKTILRRPMSPENRSSARRSVTTAANYSVHSYAVPYPYTHEPRSPTSYGTTVMVKDVMDREVYFSAAPGSGIIKQVHGVASQPLMHLVYVPATGELKDQTGSTFLGRSARMDNTLSRLSILADTTGCKHNIPAPSRSVVIAAHWVNNMPLTPGSP